jgi:hypothetical protein
MAIYLLIGLLLPFSIDVFSCYLALQRNRNQKGASGFPIITIFLYGAFIFNYRAAIYIRVLLFVGSCLVHWALLFGIPSLHSRYLEK